MSRIAIPTRNDANAETHPTLDAVGKTLGFIPNVHRLLSVSPTVLGAFVNLQQALSKTLDPKTRDGIALAVSQADGCDYCLSVHNYVATKFTKLSPEEIALNRQGLSEDPKKNAAVSFAKSLIETRGKVSDADLAPVRAAGFTDRQIIEMVALSAQFLLTNFMNNVAQTESDFPTTASE